MSRVAQLRALEALRNGVPNRDAVRVLPAGQRHIESRFRDALEAHGKGRQLHFVVEGGFGSGKSHLLQHLESLALEAGFVCSRLPVGKESPLYDADKLYSAVIEGTTLPDAVGPAMQCISDKIDPRSRLFKDFYALLCSNETLLPQIFPASVAIFERLQSDQELLEDIAQFWAGARLGVARVREGLKKISASSAFSISTVSPRDLAIHRFMFASQLIHAVGYKGWVLLLDEVELVGRYSVLQRARSYSMLAWLQGLSGAPTPFRATVAAITDDFALRVLDEKGDEETLGERLVEKGGPWADLSADAQAGMKALREKTLRILKPSAADLYDTGLALRATYAAGYGWTPPEIATDIRVDPTRSRRYYTRRWIGEWDLARLYPDRKIDVSGTTFEYRYDEDRVLDGSEEE